MNNETVTLSSDLTRIKNATDRIRTATDTIGFSIEDVATKIENNDVYKVSSIDDMLEIDANSGDVCVLDEFSTRDASLGDFFSSMYLPNQIVLDTPIDEGSGSIIILPSTSHAIVETGDQHIVSELDSDVYKFVFSVTLSHGQSDTLAIRFEYDSEDRLVYNLHDTSIHYNNKLIKENFNIINFPVPIRLDGLSTDLNTSLLVKFFKVFELEPWNKHTCSDNIVFMAGNVLDVEHLTTFDGMVVAPEYITSFSDDNACVFEYRDTSTDEFQASGYLLPAFASNSDIPRIVFNYSVEPESELTRTLVMSSMHFISDKLLLGDAEYSASMSESDYQDIESIAFNLPFNVVIKFNDYYQSDDDAVLEQLGKVIKTYKKNKKIYQYINNEWKFVK